MMHFGEMRAVVDKVQYRDWKFELEFGYAYGHRLRVKFTAPDSDTREEKEYHGRWWPMSMYMTKGEIVQTCWLAVITAVEHEAREEFLYKQRAVLGSHLDIDALIAVPECRREIPASV